MSGDGDCAEEERGRTTSAGAAATTATAEVAALDASPTMRRSKPVEVEGATLEGVVELGGGGARGPMRTGSGETSELAACGGEEMNKSSASIGGDNKLEFDAGDEGSSSPAAAAYRAAADMGAASSCDADVEADTATPAMSSRC